MEKKVKQILNDNLNINDNDIISIERLMGGRSNYMYKISTNTHVYTVRIPGKNANVFVDRIDEYNNIRAVKELNLNSPLLYFNTETGIKISEYVDGICLSDLDVSDHLPEIAEVLKSLHSSNINNAKAYDHLGRLSKYEQLVISEGYTQKRHEYLKLKERFLFYYPFLNQFEHVFCHGDSESANFIMNNNKLYLLDWEFSGLNDPFYDIACFGAFDFDLAISLAHNYLGYEPLENDLRRLYLLRSFQCLQWHNVALYKHLIGLSDDLQTPFLEISDSYLKQADHYLTLYQEI